MNITKSYIEGVKQRVELVRKAFDGQHHGEQTYAIYQLLDYLETIENFLEEEKMVCEICKNPLYKRSDGSLVCIEMTH